MTAKVYDDGWGKIERVGNGFVLTVRGIDRNTVLIINQHGGMIDTSSVPIDADDREAASRLLPRVDARGLVGRLHQGTMDDTMKAILTRWQRDAQPK